MNEYKSDILDIIKTDNFYYFHNIKYDKIFNYNNNNQIYNFTFNYITKKKSQYKIFNTSFSLDKTNYTVYSAHNINLNGNNRINKNKIANSDIKFNSNKKNLLYNKLIKNDDFDYSNGEIYKSAEQLNKININHYKEDNNNNNYIKNSEKLSYKNIENKANTSYKYSTNYNISLDKSINTLLYIFVKLILTNLKDYL